MMSNIKSNVGNFNNIKTSQHAASSRHIDRSRNTRVFSRKRAKKSDTSNNISKSKVSKTSRQDSIGLNMPIRFLKSTLKLDKSKSTRISQANSMKLLAI